MITIFRGISFFPDIEPKWGISQKGDATGKENERMGEAERGEKLKLWQEHLDKSCNEQSIVHWS